MTARPQAPADLQLRDLTEGYRLIASCRCGYIATLDPAAIVSAHDDACWWTLDELAARLKCRRCHKRLLADIEGKPSRAIIRQRLALERVSRERAAFQGGMLLG